MGLQQVSSMNALLEALKQTAENTGDLNGTLQHIARTAQAFFVADSSFLLALYQPQTSALDLYLEEKGQSFNLKKDPLEGVCQYVLGTRQVVFIRHLSEEAKNLPFQQILIKGTNVVESLIFVPLLFRDVSLGVLSIQHPDPHAYDQEDLALLQFLANHIALTLHNIRLYDNLKLLNETGQVLTRQSDTEQMLQVAVEKIREAAEADVVLLYPYDSGQKRFLLPPRIAGKLYTFHEQLLFSDKPAGIAQQMLHHPHPIFATDPLALYDDLQGVVQPGHFEQSENIRSIASLPLRVGEETVGVLFVNFRQAQSFESSQKLLIECLAHYASIAIKNTLAFSMLTQRRIHELEILQNIDRELSHSIGLRPVLNSLLEQAQMHIPAENASILLYNSRTHVLETVAAIGPHARKMLTYAVPLREMKGIIRWTMEHLEPVLIKNVHQDPRWRDLYIPVIYDTISELDVPLIDEKEPVGVLNFESIRENAFNQEDLDFLVTLSGQAVLAIKNAEAYERESRLLEEARVLNEVNKEIISHLDPTSVFDLILEKALEVTRSTRGNLMIYDPDLDDLWMAAERGVVGRKKGMRQSLDEGVVGYVAKHKQMLNVDLSQQPWRDLNLDLIPGARSELAVPMLAGDDLRGVLNIESLSAGFFTERDVRLLTALADLAVIVLQNAQAYQREMRLVEEAGVLHNISKEITSRFDPSHVFALILEKALELTNSTLGSLHLYDPNTNDLQMVMERGVAPDKKHTRQSLDQGIIGYVAKYKQRVNIPSVSEAPWDKIYQEFFPGTRSELALPLMEGDILRGVLNIESHFFKHFTDSHERLLEGLAGLAVVALQNAERYEKAEKEALRFELLYQAGQELGKLTDLAQLETAYDITLLIAEKYSNCQVVLRCYDADTQELAVVRASQPQTLPPFPRLKWDEGLNGLVARERKAKVIYDTQNPPEGITLNLSNPATRSLAVIPIYFKDRYYGNLALGDEKVASFHTIDINFFEGLADQLASTIYRLETVQERKEFEQRANSAEEMSSIGESAYEVTHRLGNDLGLVDHYINNIVSELKKQSITVSRVSKNLDDIRQSVRSVLSFSRDLKNELSKLSEEQSLREPLCVAPKALLEEAAKTLPLPSNVRVELEIDEEVRNVRIVFGRVEDILHNLVANAIQALHPKGGLITLRTHNISRAAVALEVTDTGVGIAPEKVSKIFDLFFSTKGSSGFGLWSARRIALKNHGDLKVQSQPGHGSTFTLLLPAADEDTLPGTSGD